MNSNSKQAWWAGWLLAIFLFALYCLTYSGRQMSGDELRIIDGISSFVHFGDWKLDESFSFSTPNSVFESVRYSLLTLPNDERSLSILATPLYLLAHSIPSLGMLHTVWLLNVLVTTACAVLLYVLALRLGYSLRGAFVGAVLFGATTLVWAYSKTLFREPVTMLFLVTALHMGLWVRRGTNRTKLLAVVGMAGTFALALWVKNSSVFLVPALLVWVVPFSSWMGHRRLWQVSAVFLISVTLAVVAITFVQPLNDLFVQFLTPLTARFTPYLYYFPRAFHTYLFSLNGSVFTTSPILLAGIVGAWLLWRNGQGRIVWVVLLAVLGYAFGHAVLTFDYWLGGLSYPPRFMLPVIPFAMLAVLPVVERVLAKGAWRWWVWFVPLVAFSAWLQLVNVLSFVESYTALLPPEANGYGDWLPGLNLLQYARWVIVPIVWSAIGYDLAWWRTQSSEWAQVVIVVGVVAAGCGVWVVLRRVEKFIVVVLPVLSVLIVTLMVWQLLALNERDPLTKANSTALQTAFNTVNEQSALGQPLLIAYGSLVPPVVNANRSAQFRPIALQQQKALVDTSQPFDHRTSIYDLALPYTVRFMAQLALSNERVWLLTESSPLQAWAPRVEERFLAENAYLLREIDTGGASVRLLEYDTQNQPDPLGFVFPDMALNLEFGDKVRLTGMSLPDGLTYQAGQTLPVQWAWQALEPIPYDLTVSTFLVSAETGMPLVQGHDGYPVGGFRPTTTWRVGETVYDRRAFTIPADAPEGEYILWVLLYRFEDGQPVREAVTLGENVEGTVGVVEVRLKIR